MCPNNLWIKSILIGALRTILLLIFILFDTSIFGQSKVDIDSAVIISYVDKIILKANLSTQTDTYRKIDNDTKEQYIITPNDKLRLSLSLDYEFLGASVGWAPGFLPRNNDDLIKGRSSFNNYELRLFIGNWVQRFHHSRVKGFYVQNTGDIIPNWEKGKDPFIQLPNLKTTYWNFSTSYTSNPNFSLRNLIYQTEWQRKSAKSFIPTLHLGYNKISDFEDDIGTEEKNFDMDIVLSFYTTKVINLHWYISPFISPSIGLRMSRHREVSHIESNHLNDLHVLKSIKGGIQLGYSAHKIIYGINFNFDVNWFGENEKTTVVNDKIYAKIFWGYRLNSPPFIQKSLNWFKKGP